MNKKVFTALCLVVMAVIISLVFMQESLTPAGAASDDKVFTLNDFTDLRIENEDKLVVPIEKVDEVWNYMVERYVNNKEFLQSLDPHLDSYWYDEVFTDVYFDTADLTMLKRQSGIRHRTRINLTNPKDRKSGRQLMQIKVNNIDDNIMNRGELKFKIKYPMNINDADDVHPVLGIIKKSHRTEFKQVITELGMDPYSLREILVNKQRRRSLYIPRKGQQFISIRLDECSSDLLWAKWRHVELEPELNELPYTQADSTTKAYMESINERIINDIKQKFPEIKRDLTPKYNKAFNYLERKIPFLRNLIKLGII